MKCGNILNKEWDIIEELKICQQQAQLFCYVNQIYSTGVCHRNLSLLVFRKFEICCREWSFSALLSIRFVLWLYEIFTGSGTLRNASVDCLRSSFFLGFTPRRKRKIAQGEHLPTFQRCGRPPSWVTSSLRKVHCSRSIWIF